MLVIAIDPGKKGALCSLDTYYGVHEFHHCPDPPKVKINNVDLFLRTYAKGAAYVAIEDVHSIFGASAKSNFQFGRNLGMVEALAHLHSLDVEYIQPKAWQELCGIKFIYPKKATANAKLKIRKEATAARCLALYPGAKIFGPRGGLMDGRADALMIAHAITVKYGDPDGNPKKKS